MNMEKVNSAREKITKESSDIGGPLAIFIEEHVNVFCTNEEVAASVLDKNISDLIKLIENRARQNKHGNVGMLSDTDVIEITDEFYGLKGKAKSSAAPGVIDVLDLI